MSDVVKIVELTSIDQTLDELSNLLVSVVEEGASIGFLPPLEIQESKEYWTSVIDPGVKLYVAMLNNQMVGSVQLHLCMKPNGKHRGEIAKLMTHPDFRRFGIGRSLMEKAEDRARQEGRTLLILDTREGDPSNHLYSSMGYKEVGRIPEFALSATGELDGTVIYYKKLDEVQI